MAETTSIGWCDATVNFWHGCKKVSEGCKFCYMYRDKEKYGQEGSVVRLTQQKTVERIIKDLHRQRIQRIAAQTINPLKIFTCSWSDFFIDEADSWREGAWNTIRNNPEFIWIILTKRPERIKDCLPSDWGEGWDHVWLLFSAENQERFDERVPFMFDFPAKVKGVSIEPMLGPVNITKDYPCGKGQVQYGLLLNWIIVGGESGNDTGKYLYRHCELNWIYSVVDQAKAMNIPVFVKQLGTWLAKANRLKSRAGDKAEEWNPQLRIQKFP